MLPHYAQAFYQSPPVVFNRQLRRYSLGHDFLLDAAGNPLVCGGIPSIDDLTLAVHVCGLGFREALDFARNPKTEEFQAWAHSCVKLDFKAEIAKFWDYLSDGRTVPPRKVSTDSKPHKCPWQLVVAAAICGSESMTPGRMSEIMDMPLSEALVWNAARRESLGDDTLASEEEWQIVQMGKQLAKGKGNVGTS